MRTCDEKRVPHDCINMRRNKGRNEERIKHEIGCERRGEFSSSRKRTVFVPFPACEWNLSCSAVRINICEETKVATKRGQKRNSCDRRGVVHPTMSIENIFLSPAASEPMRSVHKGTLIAGRGLEGDRYCDLRGTYSVFRISRRNPGHREPGRQLTILSADSVEDALRERDLPAPESLGDLRRNVVVRGLSHEELIGAAGRVVRMGSECRVLVHRHTVPCVYNERKNGIPGLMNAIWDASGVSCEVLAGGTVCPGDPVVITDETGPVDDGDYLPSYYIPPSRRSADMVKKTLAFMREKKEEYRESDPDGVMRADASYSTVGLTFWPKDKK